MSSMEMSRASRWLSSMATRQVTTLLLVVERMERRKGEWR